MRDILEPPRSLDALLVIPPPWGPGNPHIGMACLSAFLRREGLLVHTYDMNIDLFHRVPELRSRWDVESYHWWGEHSPAEICRDALGGHFEHVVEACAVHRARVIGLTCTYSNLGFVLLMARELKARDPDVRIVLGGPGTNSQARRSEIGATGSIDALVVGDGEFPMAAFVRSIRDGGHLESHPGLQVFHQGGQGEGELSPPDWEVSLSQYPAPDYFGLDLDRYTERALPIIFSRGCQGRCSFCEIALLWQAFRSRTVEDVLQEFEHHGGKLGITRFHNFDSAINQNPGVLTGIIQGLVAKGLGERIRWDGSFIIGRKYDEAFFRELRSAGCTRIFLGLESASDFVLGRMRKPFRAADASANIKAAAHAGIEVFLNLIVGFPGELEEHFVETMDFVQRHRQWIARVGAVTTLQIVEGTELYRNPERMGIRLPSTDFNINWQSLDGSNTPAVRHRRQEELLGLLEGLGLEVPVCASLQDDAVISERPSPALVPPLDLALVALPPWDIECPPLGPSALKTWLQHHGHRVRLIDLNIRLHKNLSLESEASWMFQNSSMWESEDEVIRLVASSTVKMEGLVAAALARPARILGLSLVEQTIPMARLFLEKLRESRPELPVIAGGPACFSERRVAKIHEDLREMVDVFVVGEGEATTLALLGAASGEVRREDLRQVNLPGVWAPDASAGFQPRPQIESLDSIPFPRFHDVDLSDYRERVLSVSWIRGCVGKCSFCNVRTSWPRLRVRSPESIVAELEHHVERGITDFTVYDSAVNVAPRHMRETMASIRDAKLPISWSALAIPSDWLVRSDFDLLAEAGCFRLEFGLESCSDDVLAGMKRRYSSEVAARNLSDARAAGLDTGVCIIVGYPGETQADFEATCRFVRENAGAIGKVSQINTLCVLPGTPLEADMSRFGPAYVPGVVDWEIPGNNYTVRKHRAEYLRKVCVDAGVPVVKLNL